MKRAFYFLIIGVLLFAFACNKGDENYSFSRPTKEQNFKTIYNGELYAYTVDDKAISRADYYLIVQGEIHLYGDTIAKYGHCWSSTVTEPTLALGENDSSTVFLGSISDTTGFTFESALTNLEAGTNYYVRTYIERKDGTIGYNPVTTLIATKPAIDEWFEQFTADKPSSVYRTDALVFNFGDTIFFGTGQQGNELTLLNDVITYLPSQTGGKGTWSTDFIKALPDGVNGGLPGELMNGIGFAIEYTKVNSPFSTKSIFIGFGDHAGTDLPADKSIRLLEYDLSGNSWTATEPFGISRSNAVCFVINGIAYIGTGKSTNVLSDWIMYDPAEASKPQPNKGWRLLQSTPPSGTPERQGAVAFTMNGIGYFGLGVTADGTFLNDFWAFTPDRDDPAIGVWQERASFPGERRANAVAFVIGEQAYVGTGDNITGDMYEGPYTGEIFNDFYRYDPYTNTWLDVRPYTADKTDRDGAIRAITRAIGFSIPSKKLGYVGYGTQPYDYVAPNPPESQSGIPTQQDFWKYQPFDDSAKK